MKRCSKCKTEKEESEFYSWKHSSDGLHNQCKPCHNLSSNNWRKNNPEKAKEYSAKWVKLNPAKAKATQKRYREANSEKCRARSRQWQLKNAERRRLLDKARRLTPQRRFIEYRAAAKQYKKFFAITYEDFLAFWQQPCHYCNEAIPDIGLDRVDSKIGYVVGNLVACCTPCNMMKKNLSQADFLRRCHLIAKSHPT